MHVQQKELKHNSRVSYLLPPTPPRNTQQQHAMQRCENEMQPCMGRPATECGTRHVPFVIWIAFKAA